MKLKEQIENWYQGRYIPPPENDPNSPIVFISPGHYEKSPGAKIVEFHLKHWAVLTTIYLALLGVCVTILIYLDPLNKSSKTPPNINEQQNINGNRNQEKPAKGTKDTGNLNI